MQEVYLECGKLACLLGAVGYGLVLHQVRGDRIKWGIEPHRNQYSWLCVLPLCISWFGPVFIWLALH